MDKSQILDDTSHGSTYITRVFLEYIIENNYTASELQTFVNQVQHRYPDMAMIQSVADRVMNSSNPRSLAMQIKLDLDSSIMVLVDKLKQIIQPHHKIITYSHSSTVSEVLKHIQYDEIYCLRSSPENEGEIMAQELQGVLIDDKDLERVTSSIDFLLLGCDSYSHNRFSNKRGTKELLDRTKLLMKPIVLAQHPKFVEEIIISDDMFEAVSLDKVELLTDVV